MSVKNSVSPLEKRIIELEDANKRLHETVAYLTHKLYGSSSEKTSALGIEDQMSLFNEAEIESVENAPEPTFDDVVSYRKKRFKGQREELLKDLPRERRFCTLVEEDRFCERRGSELYAIGEEFVRTEIEFIPAKIRVIDYYRETFECCSCRKQGEPYIEKAPMPYPVIAHSYASPSTVAWVIHKKYEMAIPLYRQEKEWIALGVKLSRATMSKWIMVTHRDWLSPVINLLHQKLLKEQYLHYDETPVQVL